MATGNAFCSLDNDSSSPYWNPAGIAGIATSEISLLYVPLWLESKYCVFNYAHPLPTVSGILKNATFGFSYYLLESGRAEGTNILKETEGSFKDRWDVFYLTYSRKLKTNVNFGLNYKIISRSFSGYDTRAMGADVGLQGKIYHGKNILSIGITFQNLIAEKMKLRREEEIPPNLKLGLGYTFQRKFTLIADIDRILGANSLPPRWYTGGELSIFNSCKLRAGINYKQTSAGFGMDFVNFTVDYAFVFHDIGLTHRFDIKFRFGKILMEEMKSKVKKLDLAGQSYRLLVNKGMQLFLEGDYLKAKEELEKVARMDPLNKQAGIRIKEVLEEIDFVVEKKKMEEAEVHYNRARQHFKNNYFEQTRREIRKALKIYPEFKKAKVLEYWNEGFNYIYKSQFEKGKKCMEKALEIEPDNEKLRKQLDKLREYMQMQKGERK